MDRAVDLHNAVARLLLHEHGGHEAYCEGDSFTVVFASPWDALAFAQVSARAREGGRRVRFGRTVRNQGAHLGRAERQQRKARRASGSRRPAFLDHRHTDPVTGSRDRNPWSDPSTILVTTVAPSLAPRV